MIAKALTDTGLVRNNNEDFYLISPENNLYIVADGMGGHLGGEVASQATCEAILEFIEREENLSGEELLKEAIKYANFSILQKALQEDLLGMGSTVVVAKIENGVLYYAWCGDARIYFFKKGSLIRLTRDHSLVEELLQKGLITEEEAFNHPRKNMVLSAVGIEEERLIIGTGHIFLSELDDGILFLVTDGLSDMLPDTQITIILQNTYKSEKIETILNNLFLGALTAGGKDNITVLTLDFRKNFNILKLNTKTVESSIFFVYALFLLILPFLEEKIRFPSLKSIFKKIFVWGIKRLTIRQKEKQYL